MLLPGRRRAGRAPPLLPLGRPNLTHARGNIYRTNAATTTPTCLYAPSGAWSSSRPPPPPPPPPPRQATRGAAAAARSAARDGGGRDLLRGRIDQPALHPDIRQRRGASRAHGRSGLRRWPAFAVRGVCVAAWSLRAWTPLGLSATIRIGNTFCSQDGLHLLGHLRPG